MHASLGSGRSIAVVGHSTEIYSMPAVVPTCARRRAPVLRQESSSSTIAENAPDDFTPEADSYDPEPTRLPSPIAAPYLSKRNSSKSSCGSLFGASHPAAAAATEEPADDNETMALLGEAQGDDDNEILDTPRGAFSIMQRRWRAERRARLLREHAERAARDAASAVDAAEARRDDRYGMPRSRRRGLRGARREEEEPADYDDDPSANTELDIASVCACCIILSAAAAWILGSICFIFGGVLYMQNKTLAESWEELQQNRAKNLGVDRSELSNWADVTQLATPLGF